MNKRVIITSVSTATTGSIEVWCTIDGVAHYSVHTRAAFTTFLATAPISVSGEPYTKQLAAYIESLHPAATFTPAEENEFNFYESFGEVKLDAQPHFMDDKTWSRYMQWVAQNPNNQQNNIN